MVKHRVTAVDDKGTPVIWDDETGECDIDPAYLKATHGCGHQSGFLFLKHTEWPGISLFYCPHCHERRRMMENGKVVTSCRAGEPWTSW